MFNLKIWTHIKRVFSPEIPEPPEVSEAKEATKAARVELIQTSMKQQRRAYEVRRELAGVALETIAKGS